MQEVFENIIEKLEVERLKREEQLRSCHDSDANDYFRCKMSGLTDAIEIVKRAAAEHNNCWIPCSERLPKYGEVVMCCCENGGITVSCITHKCVKLSKIVWFGQHRVIAWQPLPAPYQPKGE